MPLPTPALPPAIAAHESPARAARSKPQSQTKSRRT
jgi:hypothetical protein